MTFLTQKILFFKIKSCLSLVDRFRIELSDTIFEIRKKIKNESCLLLLLLLLVFQPPVAGGVPEREQGSIVVFNYKGSTWKRKLISLETLPAWVLIIIENINFKVSIGF